MDVLIDVHFQTIRNEIIFDGRVNLYNVASLAPHVQVMNFDVGWYGGGPLADLE